MVFYDENDELNNDEEFNIENESNLPEEYDDSSEKMLEKAKQDSREEKKRYIRKFGDKIIEKNTKEAVKRKVRLEIISHLAKLAPALGVFIFILLGIIMIIGIIGFFLTMPGMLRAWLDNIFGKENISTVYEAAVSVTDKDILRLADYIEDMEYDLIGHGFIKPSIYDNAETIEYLQDNGWIFSEEKNPDKPEPGTQEYRESEEPDNLIFLVDENGNKYTEDFYYTDGKRYHGANGTSDAGKPYRNEDGEYSRYGITYNSSDEISAIEDDDSVLRTYALSEKRMFILRSPVSEHLQNVSSLLSEFVDGYSGAWAKGLIELWVASAGNATEEFFLGAPGSGKTGITEDGRLKVKVGANNPIYFELDGWSGRYGLSEDFLISLHLATLSPELVTTIVQNFDTRVQVYLDYVADATVEAYFGTPDMDEDDYMPWSQVKHYLENDGVVSTVEGVASSISEPLGDLVGGVLSWFDQYYLSTKEAKEIMDTYGIESLETGRYACGGLDPSEVLFALDFDKEYNGHENFYELTEEISFTEFMKEDAKWSENLLKNNAYKCTYGWFGSMDEFFEQFPMLPVFCVEYIDEEVSDVDEATEVIGETNDELCEDFDEYRTDFYEEVEENEELQVYLEPGSLFDGTLHSYGWLETDEYPSRVFLVDDYFQAFNHNDDPFFNIEALKDILRATKDMYNLVIDDYKNNGNEKYKIISTTGEPIYEDCPIKLSSIFDTSSPYCLENIISHDSILQIEKNTRSFEEYVIAAWTTNDEGKSPTDIDYNEEKNGELVLSILVRQTGSDNFFENAASDNDYDFTLVLYKNYSQSYIEENYDVEDGDGLLCSDDDDGTETCQNCKRYVLDILKGLRDIRDVSFQTYEPYIARVVGSWFRDTYFILPEENDLAIDSIYEDYEEYEDGDLEVNNVNVITNDEPFLKATGELWTSYLYDEDDYDYALFVINPDGSYLESETEIETWKTTYYPGLPEEIYKSIGVLTKDGTDYYGYIDVTPDEESGIAQGTDIEKLFTENEVAFIKRANVISAEDLETAENEDFLGWSAYEYDSDDISGLKPITIDENSPRAMERVYKNYNDDAENEEYKDVFWYEISMQRLIAQTEDGQRGMTNEQIKYLFKNKKYYKYDGTIKKAFEIRDDWQNCIGLIEGLELLEFSDYDGMKEALGTVARHGIYMALFGHSGLFSTEGITFEQIRQRQYTDLSETALNGYVDAVYYRNFDLLGDSFEDFKFVRDFDSDGVADLASPNLEGETSYDGLEIADYTKFDYDPRNPDLINKIDLKTESLAAFSILENTHTADADYAYRDFKELICELDYFDKEDLTAPAEDVLEWALPETSIREWPIRAYDKAIEYGTLIHSKNMYSNLDLLTSLTENNTTQNPVTVATTAQTTTVDEDEGVGFEIGTPIISPATAKILEIGTVEVTNETTEDILDYYIIESDTTEATTSNENDDSKKVITETQKQELEQKCNELQSDTTNTFGKTYKTGYIKLEVIGNETLSKFRTLQQNGLIDGKVVRGIKTFYEDYYSEIHDKTICDSYIIYIEGIDLTGNMETTLIDDQESVINIDETIIGQIYNQYSDGNANISDSDKTTTNDISPREVFNISINSKEYQTNYYQKREAPSYYPEAKQDEIKKNEILKKWQPSIIKVDEEIYIKAGTLIGLTGNANIKIIMRDKEQAVVENIEDYINLEDSKLNLSRTIIGGEISASANGYRTEADILYAVNNASGWNPDMIDNVEEMMDGLLRMQNDFDIDPLVAIALFRGESSVGLAYERYGQYRLDNHQHWDGCQCTSHSDQGFACYDNYSDNAYDWGNYIRNRFAGEAENIRTWDDMANFQGMTIYEDCNLDDGEHAISFYRDLIQALP